MATQDTAMSIFPMDDMAGTRLNDGKKRERARAIRVCPRSVSVKRQADVRSLRKLPSNSAVSTNYDKVVNRVRVTQATIHEDSGARYQVASRHVGSTCFMSVMTAQARQLPHSKSPLRVRSRVWDWKVHETKRRRCQKRGSGS